MPTDGEVLRGPAALAALEVLDDLAEAGADLPLPARPTWLRLAADPLWEPLLVMGRRSGSPVAAAALCSRTQRGVTTVRLLGQGACDSGRMPALDHEAADALVSAIQGLLSGAGRWRLHLTQLPADDAVVVELARRVGGELGAGTGCPLAELDHARPLLDQVSRNGKKSANRSRNLVSRDGHVLTSRWVTGAEAVAALPDLQALRRERDHALGRASDLDTPAGSALHTGLVEAFREDTDIVVLELDGKLAAYTIGVRDGDLLRVWDGRVAVGHERWGLGWLADLALLERAHADPSLRGVDWMRGEQENKLRSATTVVPAVRLLAFSSPAVARWCTAQERAVEVLAQGARRVVGPSSRAAVRRLVSRG